MLLYGHYLLTVLSGDVDDFALFERFCVPSVMKQRARATWLIAFPSALPSGVIDRLVRIAHNHEQATILPVFNRRREELLTAVRARIATQMEDFVITTRLRPYQALLPEYLAAVQQAFAGQPRCLVRLPLGYTLDPGPPPALYLRSGAADEPVSLIERGGQGMLETALYLQGGGKRPTITLASEVLMSNEPAWVRVVPQYRYDTEDSRFIRDIAAQVADFSIALPGRLPGPGAAG